MKLQRGFAISSMSVWVTVLFLLVAGAHLAYAMNDPRWQGRALVPFLLMFVAVPIGIAAILGFTAWFLFRKSDTAGNFVYCGLVLLMVVMRIAVMTGIVPKGFSFRNSIPRPAITATNEVSPLVAPHSSAQPAPASPGSRRPQPPSSREQPVRPLSSDPKVASTLQSITTEIAAEVTEFMPRVERAFSEWSREPRHDLKALVEREAAATELRAASDRLGRRLRELQQEAKRRLEGAGVDPSTAQAEAGRFMVTYNANWRATAADGVARAADRVIDETNFLREGFSKWTIGAGGAIASGDAGFQGVASGKRSAVAFAVRDLERLRVRLVDGR